MSQILDLVLLCLFCMFHGLHGEWVENKGLWYYISAPDLSVDYEKAVSICDTLNAGLAVIVDVNQTEFLERKTNDRKYRWIGLSNNKTSHDDDDCKDATLVWNNDRLCDINVPEDISGNRQFKCTGVAVNNGIWTAKHCSEHQGFICQWECKRIYMHFEYTAYTGVYTFDRYYNNNLRYRKGDYRMYKSRSKKRWVVRRRSTSNYQYFHEADLYVPYREEMSWETKSEQSTRAGTFCIDCDHFKVCLLSNDGTKVCQNNMHLVTYSDYPNSDYPKYTNNDSSAVIKYSEYYYCMGTNDIGSWRRYICPYPKKTTNYTIENNNKLSITNECTQDHIETPSTTVPSPSAQSSVYVPSQTFSATQPEDVTGKFSSEEYTTSTYETTSISVSELRSTQNNKIITLPVSIAAVVIAIIIVAAIVSIIFVRRRKRKGQNDEDPGGVNMKHDNNTTAQYNNNVYLEFPESNSKMNIGNLPDKDCNGGEYSYADFATPGTRQTSTDIVNTSTQDGRSPGATNNERAQNKGYLAPDYGVLMDRNAKQDGKGHANNKQETNAVHLEISDSKCISHSPEKSDLDYDLQLHENEVYDQIADDKRPDIQQDDNVFYNDVLANAEHGINPQTKPQKHSTEGCLYQNDVSDSVDAGDDELELFENSVYEHTT